MVLCALFSQLLSAARPTTTTTTIRLWMALAALANLAVAAAAVVAAMTTMAAHKYSTIRRNILWPPLKRGLRRTRRTRDTRGLSRIRVKNTLKTVDDVLVERLLFAWNNPSSGEEIRSSAGITEPGILGLSIGPELLSLGQDHQEYKMPAFRVRGPQSRPQIDDSHTYASCFAPHRK